MSRKDFRKHLFCILFISAFHEKNEMNEQIDFYTQMIELKDKNIIKQLEEKFKIIAENITDIDKIIENSMTNWKITRIGKAELMILRIAVYEMKFDNIESAIAINEAVELARLFGGQDNSHLFVNGVLAKIV